MQIFLNFRFIYKMESKELEKNFTESATLLSKYYLELKNKIRYSGARGERDMYAELNNFI